MSFKVLLLATAFLSASTLPALAQITSPVSATSSVATPTTLSTEEGQNRLVEAAQQRQRVLIGTFTVDGNRIYSSPVLAASRIVFKPGATLTFSSEILQQRHELFIFADEIVTMDPEKPGTITWQKPVAGKTADLDSAAPGTDNATTENLPGGNGANGRRGIDGTAGERAPNVTIVTAKLGPTLVVDLIGGDAAGGGKGESGGQGGQGGHGNPASQGLYQCRKGAGRGDTGGNGGAGGLGGTGGAGGNGGVFTLVVPVDSIAPLSRVMQVNLGAGKPGAPGAGGGKGGIGTGGPGGADARPYCSGEGPQGNSGAAGAAGDKGEPGKTGSAGSYFIGGMTPSDVDKILH